MQKRLKKSESQNTEVYLAKKPRKPDKKPASGHGNDNKNGQKTISCLPVEGVFATGFQVFIRCGGNRT